MSGGFDPIGVATEPGHFIDGGYVRDDCATMPVYRPSDGAAHADVCVGNEALVDRAVQAAKRAQPAWAKAPPRDRARVLRRWADAMDAHVAEIARIEAVVSARLYSEALAVDVANSAEWLRYYAECCDKVDGALLPTADSALAVVSHEPYGVVGAIAPWNFPLILAMWKVAPALAAGNAVVLKPSELTPFSIARVAQLAVEAGLPAGLFNVVHGDGPSVGAAIVRHPDVAYVAFTGSTATGRRLMADAADTGPKPVGLELGGKGAQLVFADAGDLEHVAQHVAWGITRNGGQLCYAGSRLIVHASVRDELVERVRAKFAELTPKRTWEAGAGLAPILNERQAERIEGIVADSIAAGARAIVGGARIEREGGGVWYAPTILDSIPSQMRACREEIFGPVLTVQTFDDEAEGLALASDTDYGLTASVYSRDISRAVSAARALPAGTVWVNRWGRAPDFTAPFGGWKHSGIGKEAGIAGYQKYLREKAIWFDL
ncbi:MAG: aldehyde dehydrogenase family protein [Hyphomonadaceae bacterium]